MRRPSRRQLRTLAVCLLLGAAFARPANSTVTAKYPLDVRLKVGETLRVAPGLTVGGAPRFEITPLLPTGLTLDPTSGVISGTATIASSTRDFVIQTVDATDGVATSTSMTLTIEPAQSSVNYLPAVLARVGEELRLTPGVIARPPATFTVSPSLPDGLELNRATGVIQGAPLKARTSRRYRVRMRDVSGTQNADFLLEVLPSLSGISTGAREVIYPVIIEGQPVAEPSPLPTFPSVQSGKALVAVVTRPAQTKNSFDPKSATVNELSPTRSPRRLLVIGAQRLGSAVRLRVLFPTDLRRPVWIDRSAVRLTVADRATWRTARLG